MPLRLCPKGDVLRESKATLLPSTVWLDRCPKVLAKKKEEEIDTNDLPHVVVGDQFPLQKEKR